MHERLKPDSGLSGPGEQPGLSIFVKANRVIEVLADRGELSVTDLAQACEEPASSLYRLLASLTDLEWVDKGSRRGTYRLGVSFVRFAADVDWHLDIRRVVAPALSELHERTGETSYLIVRSASQGVCIDRLEGVSVRSLAMKLGGSLPLTRGGGPTVLLSYLSEDERQAVLDQLAVDEEERQQVRRRSVVVMEAGVAWSTEDVTPGVAACAAGIFDFEGNIVGALSVSGAAELLLSEADRIESCVRECAARATWAMGWDQEWPPLEAGVV